MRIVDALCLAVAIGGAVYVYNVKHKAEVAHGERRALVHEIDALSRDVGLLEADLAALERPDRLEALTEQLPETFAFEQVTADHYVRLADVPMRRALEALQATDEASTDAEASTTDGLTTGGVPSPDIDVPAVGGEIQQLLVELSSADPQTDTGEAIDRLADLLLEVSPDPAALAPSTEVGQ
ncbi:MAG: hypothetical protein AAF590_02170 [Pseudomonadota bacterium]